MRNASSLLLLLLLLTPGPGGSPGTLMAQHCPANTTILNPDHVTDIPFELKSDSSDDQITMLYVHPEPGFKGVSLVLEAPGGGDGDGAELHDAWFPLENKCFQGSAEWWAMWVEAWVSNNNTHHWLGFEVEAGACCYRCYRLANVSAVNLRVMGHGTSRWRHNKPPSGCNTTGISAHTRLTRLPSCKASPSPRTSSDPVTTWVVVTVVVLVIIVMTVIVLRLCHRVKQ